MSSQEQAQCHVLNFYYDSDSASALTFLTNGVRFHVIADPRLLDSKPLDIYNRLLTAVKTEDHEGEGQPDHQQDEAQTDEETSNADNTSNDSTQDSGVRADDDKTEEEANDDVDSAIDLSIDTNTKEPKQVKVACQGVVVAEAKSSQYSSADKSLQGWIVSLLGEAVSHHAPIRKSERQKSKTIREWYSSDTYFYELQINNGKVKAVELEATEDLQKRVSDTIPRLPLPKSLRSMDIPWLSPREIKVLAESNDPEPLHPAVVTYKNKKYFFKTVDPTQPEPTQREIGILGKIKSSGLHSKFNCPQIHGLVGYEDSHNESMGFLLTYIEDPTPLTKLLDTDVPQSKREKWAKESKRIVKVLHDNKVIWGDAKADNFMVDKDDKLWIIDFGGSYTDGWVDAELMETKEGDEMGVEKIVNALKDPVSATYDPDDIDDESEAGEGVREQESQPPKTDVSPKKRKRDDQQDASDKASDSVADCHDAKARKRNAD